MHGPSRFLAPPPRRDDEPSAPQESRPSPECPSRKRCNARSTRFLNRYRPPLPPRQAVPRARSPGTRSPSDTPLWNIARERMKLDGVGVTQSGPWRPYRLTLKFGKKYVTAELERDQGPPRSP